MRRRRPSPRYRIRKDPYWNRGLETFVWGWPERPTWLVQVLAPGIDYYVIAGFPTWREALNYTIEHNKKDKT